MFPDNLATNNLETNSLATKFIQLIRWERTIFMLSQSTITKSWKIHCQITSPPPAKNNHHPDLGTTLRPQQLVPHVQSHHQPFWIWPENYIWESISCWSDPPIITNTQVMGAAEISHAILLPNAIKWLPTRMRFKRSDVRNFILVSNS